MTPEMCYLSQKRDARLSASGRPPVFVKVELKGDRLMVDRRSSSKYMPDRYVIDLWQSNVMAPARSHNLLTSARVFRVLPSSLLGEMGLHSLPGVREIRSVHRLRHGYTGMAMFAKTQEVTVGMVRSE